MVCNRREVLTMTAKPINYINLYMKRTYSVRLVEYVSFIKKKYKLKKKTDIDMHIDKLYKTIYLLCGDLYLKKNQYNERINYEWFDNRIYQLIQEEFYKQHKVIKAVKDNDRYVKQQLIDINKKQEQYD